MTAAAPWPSAVDYIGALQHPQLVFRHPPLRAATFDLDDWGAPDAATGSNAAVFRATVGGAPTAIRCFTSSAGFSRDRYETLNAHRATIDLPSAAEAHWTDDALTVNRHVWPIVQMEWVDGRTLDEYLKFLCEREPGALGEMAERWRGVLVELADAGVAHGDLQHGNVLVDQTAQLRLVDLDGVWVSSGGAAAPPEEYGHPAYRHPEHVGERYWGRLMDAFPGLLIYTSIRALAAEPELWATYNNGANLLFAPDDLRQPGRTPIWDDLRRVNDRDVTNLAERLAACCRPGWVPEATGDRLVDGERSARSRDGGGSTVEGVTSLDTASGAVEVGTPDLPWDMQPVQEDAPTGTTPPPPPAPDVHTPSIPDPPTVHAPGTSWFDNEGAPVAETPDVEHDSGRVVAAIVALVIVAIVLIWVLQRMD